MRMRWDVKAGLAIALAAGSLAVGGTAQALPRTCVQIQRDYNEAGQKTSYYEARVDSYPAVRILAEQVQFSIDYNNYLYWNSRYTDLGNELLGVCPI
jgi:hypothetical protein